MKKKLIALLQFAIGIGLIAFIFYRMDNKSDMLEALRAGAQHWPIMVLGVSSFLVCLLLCMLRWKLLLDARGMHLPFGRIFQLYFIGQFFNSFLFGATGGDVVKAWFVTREMPDRKTEAVSTVVLDRIIGLAALVILTVIIMLFQLPFFLAHEATRWSLVFFGALLGGMIGFLALTFGHNWMERWAFFKRLEERTALGKIITRAYGTVRDCMQDPMLLVKTLTLSIANHVVLIGCAYGLGRGLEISLNFWGYLKVFPVINAVAAIPATPGGLGTRETAAKFLLGVLGVAESRAVLLSLLIYIAVLFWSLVGGGIYMLYIAKHGRRTEALEGSQGAGSEAG
ncbi:MAG: flippase-like domain-containing protein [Verrucomicrobia bacterium]|jgi:glycosyltransferase 2 family protein|nr:flippase-like domain-containing protein [Verrucomicrobiota bacterium]MBT7066913.1 flippase-like domain-containing protein [Verrucomicrobiota bacterium]MBT7699121.1 flippase-like domain-containing protein [Verrucomicrobiota bacterium]